MTEQSPPAAGAVGALIPEDISGKTSVRATPENATPKSDAGEKSGANAEKGQTAAKAAPASEPKAASDGAEGDQASAENPDAEGRRKRPGGYQKKIAKQAEEIEFWKAEALRGRSSEAPKPTAEKPPEAEKAPSPDDFDTYDEYVRADARFQARQEVKSALDEQKKTERLNTLKADHQKRVSEYNERTEKVREKYADFDEVLSSSDAPMNDFMRDAVLESDLGPELVYHLAQNPEKAEAMVKMGITQLNREIGKLEVMLEKAEPVVSEEPEPAPEARKPVSIPSPKVTKAPPPITPVKSAPANETGTYKPTMSQAEYERWRAKGGGRRV